MLGRVPLLYLHPQHGGNHPFMPLGNAFMMFFRQQTPLEILTILNDGKGKERVRDLLRREAKYHKQSLRPLDWQKNVMKMEQEFENGLYPKGTNERPVHAARAMSLILADIHAGKDLEQGMQSFQHSALQLLIASGLFDEFLENHHPEGLLLRSAVAEGMGVPGVHMMMTGRQQDSFQPRTDITYDNVRAYRSSIIKKLNHTINPPIDFCEYTSYVNSPVLHQDLTLEREHKNRLGMPIERFEFDCDPEAGLGHR